MNGYGTLRKKKKEQGAAMVESILAMLVLFLFFFGSLQLILLYFAQDFTDYAVFRGARSNAVGFAHYLVNRETKINAIGASGRMVVPVTNSSKTSDDQKQIGFQLDNINSFEDTSLNADALSREKTLIQKFMLGIQYIEYEYWNGGNKYEEDNQYINKQIKQDAKNVQTSFSTQISSGSRDTSTVSATFTNYAPCEHPFYKLFRSGTIDITGEASLADHSSVYLEN